jgi:hypothetical protein
VTSRRLGLTRRFHLKNTGDGRRGLSCAVAEKKKSQRSCSGHWTTFSGLYPRTPVCQPSVAYSLGTSRGLRCHLDYLDAELSLWLLLGRRQSQTVNPCAHIIQQSNRIIIPPESSSRLGARIVVRQIDALASVKARQKSRHPECRSSTQCLCLKELHRARILRSYKKQGQAIATWCTGYICSEHQTWIAGSLRLRYVHLDGLCT